MGTHKYLYVREGDTFVNKGEIYVPNQPRALYDQLTAQYGEGNWMTQNQQSEGPSYRERKAYAESRGSSAVNLIDLRPALQAKVSMPAPQKTVYASESTARLLAASGHPDAGLVTIPAQRTEVINPKSFQQYMLQSWSQKKPIYEVEPVSVQGVSRQEPYYAPRYSSPQETMSLPTTQLKYDVFGKPVSIIHEHPSNLEHKWTVQTEIWKNKMWSPGLNYQYAALAVGSTFALDLFRPIRHPVQTVKAMLDPGSYVETGKGLITKTLKGDLTVIGDAGALYVGGKIIGKGVKVAAEYGPRYSGVELPLKTGEVITYEGLYIKSGSKAYPVVGKGPAGIAIGLPKSEPVSLDLVKGRLEPASALEAKVIPRWVNLAPAEQVRISSAINVMRATQYTKSAYISDTLPRDIKTMGVAGVETTINWMKETGGQPYGSFTAKAQMPETVKGIEVPKPSDIDVTLNMGEARAVASTNILVNRLRGVGEPAVIGGDSPTLVSIRGHHAVDVHFKGMDAYGIKAPELGYGFTYGQPTQNIEGLPAMRLSEQGLRKGSASLGISEEGVMPKGHRLKDIGHFILTQETLIKSIKNPFKRAYAEGQLKLYIESYPEGVVARSLNLARASPEISFKTAPSRMAALKQSPPISPLRYPKVSALASASMASVNYKISMGSVSSSVSGSVSRASPRYSVSASASLSPRYSPSLSPSLSPRYSPSLSPSLSPRYSPSLSPSLSPRYSPSLSPSLSPRYSPSLSPSVSPSMTWPPITTGASLKLPDMGNQQPQQLSSFKGLSFNPKYVASVEAGIFNIRGRASRSITALGGLRPLR